MQELRGRQRGGEDRFRCYIQSHKVQPYLQVARGVQRVIGKNQERDSFSLQPLHKLCRPWDERRPPQDDPIHICQVILYIVQ